MVTTRTEHQVRADFLKSRDKPLKAGKEVLKDYGFKIQDTPKLLEDALDISRNYGLLFSDALHSACCKVHGIANIAARDADFERVSFLNVWKPQIEDLSEVVFEGKAVGVWVEKI